jgi:hypothetical protein
VLMQCEWSMPRVGVLLSPFTTCMTWVSQMIINLHKLSSSHLQWTNNGFLSYGADIRTKEKL